MEERSGAVTMKGNPLTLLGGELKAGDKAPDFEVLNNDLSTFSFSSYRGKICVISSVPFPGYARVRYGDQKIQRRGW